MNRYESYHNHLRAWRVWFSGWRMLCTKIQDLIRFTKPDEKNVSTERNPEVCSNKAIIIIINAALIPIEVFSYNSTAKWLLKWELLEKKTPNAPGSNGQGNICQWEKINRNTIMGNITVQFYREEWGRNWSYERCKTRIIRCSTKDSRADSYTELSLVLLLLGSLLAKSGDRLQISHHILSYVVNAFDDDPVRRVDVGQRRRIGDENRLEQASTDRFCSEDTLSSSVVDVTSGFTVNQTATHCLRERYCSLRQLYTVTPKTTMRNSRNNNTRNYSVSADL